MAIEKNKNHLIFREKHTLKFPLERDELRGWKHLGICPYSYPVEFVPGDDFHLLNGVIHTMRLSLIMGWFSSHQGQKTTLCPVEFFSEWKNGNYSSTLCSFIISFILLVLHFQLICDTIYIPIQVPQVRQVQPRCWSHICCTTQSI